MTLETALIGLLEGKCPRVFPVVAPFSTPTPYITWQHIGGQSLRYADNTAGDRRNAEIQLNVWADTSYEAFALIRAVEDALCASAALQATPQGEPMDSFDEGDTRRGALQSFSIWGDR